MKKIRRILLAVHPHFRPDGATAGVTERHVWSTLKRLGYATRVASFSNDLSAFERELTEFNPQIVFNLIEEFRGQAIFDFHLVSLLEAKGIPFTGCNPRGLVVSRNKLWISRLAAEPGISVPPSGLVGNPRLGEALKKGPLFVKFNREHASLGISQTNRVDSAVKLARSVSRLRTRMNAEILVQQFIPGLEVTVSVWGNRRPYAFPPWQLDLRSRDSFATERVKFSAKFRRQKGIRARQFRGPGADRARSNSLRLFRLLDLNGYIRFDYRITESGEPFLIDVNPNPNLARDEDFACSVREGGVEYPELIEKILELGLRYQPRF
jgi:D-alanine-D-alanine ligase